MINRLIDAFIADHDPRYREIVVPSLVDLTPSQNSILDKIHELVQKVGLNGIDIEDPVKAYIVFDMMHRVCYSQDYIFYTYKYCSDFINSGYYDCVAARLFRVNLLIEYYDGGPFKYCTSREVFDYMVMYDLLKVPSSNETPFYLRKMKILPKIREQHPYRPLDEIMKIGEYGHNQLYNYTVANY